MSKSSFLNNKKVNKSDIAIICILLMVSGLLISRLFLSLGMILFGINALWNVSPRKWIQNKWWLAGLAWVAMYAISWFWSTNKEEWGVFLQLKLPVILLPLAFPFVPRFTARQLQNLTLAMGLMFLAGAGYSISFLVRDYAHFIQEYNVSHILPTPVYRDYLCFSVSCALYIAWVVYMWPRLFTNSIKWIIAAACALLFIYLHVLASKSGLIAIYIFAISYAVYSVIAKRSVAGILGVLAIPVFLYCAVTFIPTLRERKEHIVYTWYRYMDQDKTGKLGDLSRLMSYDISVKLIKEQPLQGVGTGDMLDAMKVGYAKYYPNVTEEINKLIPHNQFLAVGLGCGIPAMLLFALWVLMPLFRKGTKRDKFFLSVTWTMLLLMLFIEPFLESQFGVFIYLFFLLMVMHTMGEQEEKLT